MRYLPWLQSSTILRLASTMGVFKFYVVLRVNRMLTNKNYTCVNGWMNVSSNSLSHCSLAWRVGKLVSVSINIHFIKLLIKIIINLPIFTSIGSAILCMKVWTNRVQSSKLCCVARLRTWKSLSKLCQKYCKTSSTATGLSWTMTLASLSQISC